MRLATLAALILGGLASSFVLSSLESSGSAANNSIVSVELPRCIGRRPKAERIALWRARVGLDSDQIPIRFTPASITFNRDIAPILFDNCAVCHRPGEVAPFSVLSYDQVRPWAWLIGVVTKQRYMPPWPPGERADAEFVGKRALSQRDIDLIQAWIKQGAVEGPGDERPPVPVFTEGWTLGEPDLVVSLPSPFELAANGIDVYRNLVLPIPIQQTRWVRAVEIRPGNKRTVHHAVLQMDRFGTGRQLDAREPGHGFSGMDMGSTENPGGHFIGWSPGKAPLVVPDDMAFKVGPGTDMILQLHMLPTGSVEQVSPRIGLYFTDHPGQREPFSLVLRNGNINIPAGEQSYIVEDRVKLPVDIDVLAVFPHAHYLGKDVSAIAHLPDGRELTLIHIDDWDFGWQDEYRYQHPPHLPAGTEVAMRFEYDNSAKNPRNPNQPPKRVVAGNSSLDEMAILMLQVTSDEAGGEARVREAVMRSRLERDPESWFAHNLLGASLRSQGRIDEAIQHFEAATRLNPAYAGTSYNLGNAYQAKGDTELAIKHYRHALQLDPDHGQAHNNLGSAFLSVSEFDLAIRHFRKQLTLNPSNVEVLFNLGTALQASGHLEDAAEHYTQALAIDERFLPARVGYADTLRLRGQLVSARRHYHHVLREDPMRSLAHLGLGLTELAEHRREQALERLRHAAELDQRLVYALNDIAWQLSTQSTDSRPDFELALRLAEAADAMLNQPRAEFLDTLAAAQAATGAHRNAVLTLRRALEIVGAEHPYTPQFAARLEVYERGQRYIE